MHFATLHSPKKPLALGRTAWTSNACQWQAPAQRPAVKFRLASCSSTQPPASMAGLAFRAWAGGFGLSPADAGVAASLAGVPCLSCSGRCNLRRPGPGPCRRLGQQRRSTARAPPLQQLHGSMSLSAASTTLGRGVCCDNPCCRKEMQLGKEMGLGLMV